MDGENSSYGISVVIMLVILSTLYFVYSINTNNRQPNNHVPTQGLHEPHSRQVKSSSSRYTIENLTDTQLRLHKALPIRHGSRTITISIESLIESFAGSDERGIQWKSTELSCLLLELVHIADVYIISNVPNNCSSKGIQNYRENFSTIAEHLLQEEKDKLPPHKLLFCTTNTGKIAFVRQLEPQLHIETNAHVIKDLQKHVPRIVLATSEAAFLPSFDNNVYVAEDLVAYFHALGAVA